jgi:hypothetical protein
MTTDDGSSRSQAEVHKGVADWVVKSDADLLCESFNRGPVAWLTEWNFPGAQPPRVWRHTEPAENLQARAERVFSGAGCELLAARSPGRSGRILGRAGP